MINHIKLTKTGPSELALKKPSEQSPTNQYIYKKNN